MNDAEKRLLFDVLEEQCLRHPWLAKLFDIFGRLIGTRDETIEKLTKERDDWKRLAEDREEAHTQGHREGRALADLTVLEYKSKLAELAHKHEKLLTRLKNWSTGLFCWCDDIGRTCDKCIIDAFVASDRLGE